MKHLLLTTCLLASLASAQTPTPASDPTVPDDSLQRLLAAAIQNKASELSMPAILMRGKIIPQSGPGLVILEVNKQILSLKQGGALSLSGEFSHLSLQLSELTREGATIEVLPLKKTLQLQ